jgi:1-pyrroline-5-carboxylate dehydrogenase
LIHHSADMDSVVNNLVRSAFEYSGQKCSACSRAYIPSSKWGEIKEKLNKILPKLMIGQPDDPNSFTSSVIDSKAFKRITAYIERAKSSPLCEVMGGEYDDSIGQFIQPTIIVTKDPKYESMVDELFGPVLTVYVYEDSEFEDVLSLIDETSVYGLTGSIFSRDRNIIRMASDRLRDCAGNLYINDKSTGAVVGQQPFGGSRLSGTNDKSGAEFILSRWVSMRTTKENFEDLKHWGYPSVDSSK